MRLARIFTDNAVFRANAPLRLFGQGKGEISITLCGNTYKQTVTEENWIAEFPAQPYGGLYNMKIELCGDGRGAKNETIVLKNVAFGEVLLCAGQSNMQFELREEINADTARENPKIRYYFSDNPERNCHLNSSFGWLNAAAENLPYFSALGYHTAEEIVRQKDVYVGLIACFQGASAIRSWLSPEVLTPEVFVPVELRHSDSREPLYAAFNRDGACYENTFTPIVPYGVSCVMWYQGESDTSEAEGKVYLALLKKLIGLWRKDLRNENLPFIVVQICDLNNRADEGWRAIQCGQAKAETEIPQVKTVTSRDVCSHESIHPNDKRALALKTARAYFALTERATEKMKMLTREEKIRLNMGKDGWSSYSPNEEIPSFRVTDGPVGVRMIGEDGKTIPSVAYPCFQSLAQTWNLTLAEKYADALADDCVDLGADILLGPGVNIKRTPLCGRNFEYFSEDPFVAGEFGRHYITALQKRGIGACLKHYCCNNQEEERYWISSEVDERTLREIYLKPFEIACKAKPWAVMTSYNRVNGVQVNESAKLHRVLREEFGFCGVVMSDWWAVHRPTEALNAGTNLIMPFDEKTLEKLIKSNSISEIALEENNRRVIDLAKKCAEARKTRCKKYSVEERREIARETAEEGIVLLKNNGVLPLSAENAGSLPVMGAAAERYYYGGGSSAVVPEIPYEKLHEALQKEGVAGAHFAWNEETGTFRNCAKEAETSYAVIVAVGDPSAVESEEKDRTSLRLSPEEELYIRELSKVNRNVIAVVYAGAPIDMSGWIGEVSAVVWAGYGGEKVNEAVARVLTGKVNPSGKTAETFPLSLADVPAYRAKRTAESAYYEEGRAVGYRHFAKENASVLFPFGFGLSYSEFRYVDLTLKETAQTIEASFTVKNLSPRGGKETAQLYFSHKAAEEETQCDEFALKGFVKFFVAANSETRAKIEIKKADLSYYSVSSCEWKRYKGECQIFVGKNCNDLPLQAKIIL